MNQQTLYGPFTQLLTLENLPLHGSLFDSQLQIKTGYGILVENGIVIEIDDFDVLVQSNPGANLHSSENQNWVVLPGFVDCHTHICWGGTRVNDYAMRVAGKSYLEISAAGGGIMDTVLATREASEEELISGILNRVDQHIRRGITTIEVKSGYGLSHEDEIKMLECIKAANDHTQANLIPTFLGAHIKPKDFGGSPRDYLGFLLDVVVPEVQEKELASRADIFVEEGAFGLEESKWYAHEMMKRGFEMTMHVDQFHAGGSDLANELGCVSADHLEFTDEEGIQSFKDSETVAVALPGASLGLGMRFTPARKLLDNSASVAIATDWNPGSAPMGDLLTQASILGASEKLTIAETLAAITVRAAHALRVNAGTISVGNEANFTIFETNDFRNIFYRQGQLQPAYTIIGNSTYQND